MRHQNPAVHNSDQRNLIRCRVFSALTKVALIVAFLGLPAHADSPPHKSIPMLNLTAGAVGIADDLDDPFRFGMEYRFKALKKHNLIPAIGFAVAENGAYFIYSDLRYDYRINDNWLAIPSFGVGTFNDSEELILGNELEFRPGIEIAYRFPSEYRIGVALFHISNGGLSEKNPGTESLVLSLCIPLK